MRSFIVCMLTVIGAVIDVSAQWQQRSTQHQVTSLTFNGSGFFAGTINGYGVIKSADNGLNWGNLNTLNKMIYALHSNVTETYAGTTTGAYKSTTGGSNWSPPDTASANFTPLAFAQTGSYLFFAANGGVFRSTNYGLNWSAYNNGLLSTNVTAVVTIGDVVFAGTGAGSVFKSTGFGFNWSSASFGLPGGSNLITCLYADGSTLYAGVHAAGIYKSVDSGSTWTSAANGLPGSNDVLCITSFNGNIFAGTYGSGVYRSTDGGLQWTSINNGIANNPADLKIHALAIASTDIFAGTENGIYKRNLTQVVGLNEMDNTPMAIRVFPNPAKKEIVIQVGNDLTHNRLEIYNSAGSLVYSAEAASTQQTIATDFLTSGIYFIKISAGSRSGAYKFIVE